VKDAGTKHVPHYEGQPAETRQKTLTPNTSCIKKKACRRQALQIQAEHPKVQAEQPMARQHQTRFVLKMGACRRQALQIQAEHPIARQAQTDKAGTKHALY
jgi:hypothetical protein